MEDRELIRAAIRARENAYCPYSGYGVGAALLAASGRVYGGCNIENAAFGPTNCAERTAFFKALSEGERQFRALAIVGGPTAGALQESISPCGVCRQVMAEFCPPDFRVLLAWGEGEGQYRALTLGQLLPLGFGPGNLNRERSERDADV